MELTTTHDESLKRYLLISLGAHVAFVLAMLVNTYVFPREPIELVSAIRVDMVDLPDKLVDREVVETPKPVPVAPKAEVKPEPKVEKPPEKAVNLERKQNDALAKLKQESAIEKLQKEVESENKKKPAPPAAATFKGNQITTGTELRGLARAQHDQYVGSLERVVRGNWALPEWLANKNLKAQVRIKVNAKGEVVDIKLIKPSGNPSFDENVMMTVQKSSPLPPPPERLEILLRNEGIVLGFPE